MGVFKKLNSISGLNQCGSFCLGIKKRKAEETENSNGSMVLVFLLVSMVCAACFLYIFQVNKLATMGYDIKKNEKTIQELKETNQQLRVEAAQLKSIHNIEQKKEEMNLKKPQSVGYVEIENPCLVSSR